jgi:amylosucrase
MHRPRIDWDKVALRERHGTVEQRLFDGLRRMIAVRKSTPAFADYNNRYLIESGNPHLFVFMRSNPALPSDSVLVVANFDSAPQSLDLGDLSNRGHFGYSQLRDLYSGEAPNRFGDKLVVPPRRFYWLTDSRLN